MTYQRAENIQIGQNAHIIDGAQPPHVTDIDNDTEKIEKTGHIAVHEDDIVTV